MELTAFELLHKLRAGMGRPERDTIGSQYLVEVDEAFVGGRPKGQGRGVHHMALTGFVQDSVVNGATVRTDDWRGYDDLARMGYAHEPLVLNGDPERAEAHLPMIHIAFSNLKTWLLGTHHGVSHQHLQAYLNEFVFRFNRRFYPMTAFISVLGLVANAKAPTYEMLYSGKWDHPKT